jgi:polar amino acid transport system substrate-binding protein
MSRLLVRIGVPVLALLALAGCGSSSTTTSGTSSAANTAASAPTAAVDPAIAALVPAKYKAKGTLNVASEAQYAPNEFIAPDGHTVIGMDADLMNALARLMGLKVRIINSNFETIIPGLAAGRYDVGASSFTDTKEREKTVDFVTYFQAGISFYDKASSSSSVNTIAALCGKTVAVEKGTTEQEEATKQSSTCTKEGKKPVNVLSFPGQNPVNLAVASGRAELGMADSPVVEYQIKQSNGQFKLLCKCYGFAPYGIALPKNSGLTSPFLEGVKKLIADGDYARILTRWGIQSGAIDKPVINGAQS